MPVTTVFLFITGMSIVAWIVLLGCGITDNRDTDFYTAMTKVVGVTYTTANMLIQILVEIS